MHPKNAVAEPLPAFPADLTRQERNSGKVMIHLIRYFCPEELVTTGEKSHLTEWITLQHRQGSVLQGGLHDPLPFQCRRMVIISGRRDTSPPAQPEEVWVVTSLQAKENRDLWENILMLSGVRVSVETRNTGILFFHPVLPVERYVIRRWFYL